MITSDDSCFEELYQQYGSNFTDWIEDQDLNHREESIWLFHYWMREHSTLESGSIKDYRKYIAPPLNEDGELEDVSSDLGSHRKAAVNKFRESDLANLGKEAEKGDVKSRITG